MKIKSSPEDFIVKEVLPEGFIKESGEFEVYSLVKRLANTLDCIKVIKKEWATEDIGYCGLKDKHGVTTQYLTVKKGREFAHNNFKVRYVGKAGKHLERGGNLGNDFIITLQVTPEEIALIRRNESRVKLGYTNFFDVQRTSRELPHISFTHYLLEGDYKTALLRYYINKSKLSNSRVKSAYKECFKNWDDPVKCYSMLKGLVSELVLRPLKEAGVSGDYFNAIKKIPPSELELLVAGHQALLWNNNPTVKLPVVNLPLFKIKRAGTRELKVKPSNLKISYSNDEVIVSFFLPKGAYATILIKELFKVT
ncbi:MAG TPA: tRNA pseudouridine(13) synthase TruD [Candidatus Nanoarchaeia archaeon]|nr:tRNA pseudouridine(13) synthase TruD [Candidatus Nanoarchaeia archaeon]